MAQTEQAGSLDAKGSGLDASNDSRKAPDFTLEFWKDGWSVNKGEYVAHTEVSRAVMTHLALHAQLAALRSGTNTTSTKASESSQTSPFESVLSPPLPPRPPQLPARPVDSISDPEHKAQDAVAVQQRHDDIEAELVRYQISSSQAKTILLNELADWSLEQVKAVFESIGKDRSCYPVGPAFNKPGETGWKQASMIAAAYAAPVGVLGLTMPIIAPLSLLSGQTKHIKQTWDAAWEIKDASAGMRYLKAPISKLREAVETGGAACVNKKGEVKVVKSGYIALSHVWGETFGWNGVNGHEVVPQDVRGMNREHLSRIMKRINMKDDEWLWMDNIAIPGTLPPDLHSAAINTMPSIYQNAKVVLILDSLTMQLKTRSLIDVAVVLICGIWITRVWTYQEIKLADPESIYILTADGRAHLGSIFRSMHELARNEDSKYSRLFSTLIRLQKPVKELDLVDIAHACQVRLATVDVDYARAFFPTLGLEWNPSYDRERGMVEIYSSRPQEAAQLGALHGPRGLPDPWGWAPAYLCGNEGPRREDLRVNTRGELVGSWFSVEVLACTNEFSRGEEHVVHDLSVRNSQIDEPVRLQITTSSGLHLRVDYAEKMALHEKSRAKFLEWQTYFDGDGKTAFLLCSEPLEAITVALQVLLVAVEDQTTASMMGAESTSARVFASAALNFGVCHGRKGGWVLK